MKFTLRITLTVIFLISFVSLKAQSDSNPVSWSTSTQKVSNDTFKLIFRAKITSPWHMYDMGPYNGGPNATTFTFEPNSTFKLSGGMVQLTKSIKEFDKLFDMEIGYFVSEAIFEQIVKIQAGATEVKIKANVEWMVCDDQNCLPPTDIDFIFKVSSPDNAASAAPTTINGTLDTPSGEVSSETSDIGDVEQPNTTDSTAIAAIQTTSTEAVNTTEAPFKSLWSTIIEAILWGFAALLTPCVFPMVPMTVSFFMKGSENPARGRLMASLYGLAIITLYTLPIAVIIAVTRLLGGDSVTADIFNWLATHWIPNVIFFIVFMLFAASFFGAFEITLPSWMVNKSDSKADKGGLVGLFFMAMTLVLVSFSCTGPIVGSVLIKSTSGEIWAPVITMLAFSTAFALPFTLFAFFPSMLKNLPKSGGWLNSVKVVLGFLELALGLKFLSVADQTYHWGILDREIYLALWIVIFTMLGLYLLGKLRFSHDSEFKSLSVPRLLLAIITFSFVGYMIPGMWGAPLRGLSGYLPPMHTQDFILGQNTSQQTPSQNQSQGMPNAKYSDFLSLPHGLTGFFDYNEALEYARKVGKPLFVDYTGHGCVNCREMEARVWSNPEVLNILRNDFVIVALYSDDKKVLPESQWVTTEKGKVLKSLGKINAYFAHKNFGINSQPYYMIMDKDGKQVVPGMGYNLNVPAFEDFLRRGIDTYNLTVQ